MPGSYEVWSINDAAHPFPVPDITVDHADDSLVIARCLKVAVPNAIPYDKSRAERSAGITGMWRIKVGLLSDRRAGGQIDNTIYVEVKHLHWWPDHPETGPGPELTGHASVADIFKETAWLEKDAEGEHGPHLDKLNVSFWKNADGTVHVSIVDMHAVKGESHGPGKPSGKGTVPAASHGGSSGENKLPDPSPTTDPPPKNAN